MMKKFIFLLATALFSLHSYSQTSLGGGIQITGHGSALEIRGEFDYTPPLTLVPQVSWIGLGTPGMRIFTFQTDGHLLMGDEEEWDYYPLAGLGIFSYSTYLPSRIYYSEIFFTLNLGGGVSYRINPDWKFYSEFKFYLGGGLHYAPGFGISLGAMHEF